MRYAIASAAFATLVAATPVPQGVTEAITPPSHAPAGCVATFDQKFQIQVVNVSSTSTKRSFEKRQEGALILTLKDGILLDALGRTGYIADNRQFQFDGPAQTGAIYTAGWSICPNNTLAIGGDLIFEQCLSGTFYNLYDDNNAAQCSPVYIEAINAGGAGGGSGGAPAAPVSQIGDGQIQASTSANPVTQIGDGQIQAPTGFPVTQIGDGQIQAPTGSPVTQIGDGQIQAPTGAPVTQIGDGQIQAPTGAPVTQIVDGQIQAPTGSPVTQIADGQIQAATGRPVTQIGDGQIQAPTNGSIATPTPSVQVYTGAAAMPIMSSEFFALAAGLVVFAML